MYYIICTYISPPTRRLLEVGAYPPATIEEERLHLEEKNGYIVEGEDRSLSDSVDEKTKESV